MKKDYVELPIGNYYGNVVIFVDEGVFYMGIQDNDKFQKTEISKEVYQLLLKEFK